MGILDLQALILLMPFTFSIYAFIESERKLGWIGPLRVCSPTPPAQVPFTKQMHG